MLPCGQEVRAKLTGAWARLGLARAKALEARAESGNVAHESHAKAIAAYRDFFDLWKDADAEIPIFQQAKREYVQLQ